MVGNECHEGVGGPTLYGNAIKNFHIFLGETFPCYQFSIESVFTWVNQFCSVSKGRQQLSADLRTTILAILNSCQSFGTVPMQRLPLEIGKLRQFSQLFAAIPTLLAAIRHHASLPRAICRNRRTALPQMQQKSENENYDNCKSCHCEEKIGTLNLKQDKVNTADSAFIFLILSRIRNIQNSCHKQTNFIAHALALFFFIIIFA